MVREMTTKRKMGRNEKFFGVSVKAVLAGGGKQPYGAWSINTLQ
jgi:hypothetical protein